MKTISELEKETGVENIVCAEQKDDHYLFVVKYRLMYQMYEFRSGKIYEKWRPYKRLENILRFAGITPNMER